MSVILRFLRQLGFLKPRTAVNFKGQLVFQWPARVRGALAPVVGTFEKTMVSKALFEKTVSLIQGKYDLEELMVGYRNFADDDYTPVFPPGLGVFRVA